MKDAKAAKGADAAIGFAAGVAGGEMRALVEHPFLDVGADAELAGRTPDEARRWFDKEFTDLECEPSNPVGKVLIIDKIADTNATVHRIEDDTDGKV